MDRPLRCVPRPVNWWIEAPKTRKLALMLSCIRQISLLFSEQYGQLLSAGVRNEEAMNIHTFARLTCTHVQGYARTFWFFLQSHLQCIFFASPFINVSDAHLCSRCFWKKLQTNCDYWLQIDYSKYHPSLATTCFQIPGWMLTWRRYKWLWFEDIHKSGQSEISSYQRNC